MTPLTCSQGKTRKSTGFIVGAERSRIAAPCAPPLPFTRFNCDFVVCTGGRIGR